MFIRKLVGTMWYKEVEVELVSTIWYKEVEVINMNYNFKEDLCAIREILGLTQEELAEQLDVDKKTILRNEGGKTEPSIKFLDQIYTYAFEKKIKLNKLKEMFWKDNLKNNHRILFHGSKSKIEGELSINIGRTNNDFGQGFYAGESYEQAISFVSGFEKPSVYFIDFDEHDLKCKKYEVNQEWMMTIAYYRGVLEEYENHPIVKNLVEKSRDCDYIIAPIADNRMFQTINSFISGEITDEQCKHCLAATQLGFQYVFISEKAIKQVKLIERCYISNNEKEYYKNIRTEDVKLGDDKVKLARRQYRGIGQYIDEILS